jgi:hypothetical protein
MKKELVIAKKKQHRSIEEIMRDPSLRAKLNVMVDEAVNCKQRISHEQMNIKALREAALEELGLKPQLFNNYVAMVFNNDYQVRKEGLEQQLTLVELVLGETQSLTNDE